MSHFWSLAVEEHFYLVWPLIFLMGPRIAFYSAACFALACIVMGPVLASYFPAISVSRWTFPAAAPIAFGCVAAFICNDSRVTDMFSSKKIAPVLLVAILSGLASPAFYRSDFVWMASISALILYVYHNQESALVRALEFKPLAVLGLISYGLYVWQGFFTGNGPYRTGAQFPPALDTGLWLTFIVAPISYLFFEQPILKLKNRFSWRSKSNSKTELTTA
jgi:peptidoglycan/LPS O-acetylase OafA/YrhL